MIRPFARQSSTSAMQRLLRQHDRHWHDYVYVYPVISRRSRGLSIGINLNVDKVCNFDCVYCLVDRSEPTPRHEVHLDALGTELETMLQMVADGAIWSDPAFAETPDELRRLNDIAFSGDGEPTAYPHFDSAVALAARVRDTAGLSQAKLVVLTNATLLYRDRVQRGLATLDRCNGEIWAKLDAGTQAYYEQVDRSAVPLSRVMDNLLQCARRRPIVIQTLVMKLHGEPIGDREFDAYLSRLAWLIDGGGKLAKVQLYTTARRTAEPYVAPLDDDHLDELAARLKARQPGLKVEAYYGVK
jgi:wyosine [tRNA(Phe)-imidazoG37] synthetase (radical SAM superfamily)